MALPRGMWLVVALVTAPACTCSNGNAGTSRGCGGGGYDSTCGLFDEGEPCAPPEKLDPHMVGVRDWLCTCRSECESGWSDCDVTPGCETFGKCPEPPPFNDASVAWLVTLSDAPLGLAVCGDELVFADGAQIFAASKTGGTTRTLALLDDAPTGGLACDDKKVYLPLRRVNDAGIPQGRIVGLPLKDAGSDAEVTFAAAVDPARSIDLDDAGGVFWLTRRDAGTFLTRNTIDASDGLLLPIDEPQTYKTFALYDGVWAIGGGDVRHRVADGAVDLLADANAVAITARPSGVTLLTRIDGGAQLGDASFMSARAMTSFGPDLFIATDDSITHVSPLGALSVVASQLSHVVDLAVDDKYVYFTTLGPPATLSRAPW